MIQSSLFQSVYLYGKFQKMSHKISPVLTLNNNFEITRNIFLGHITP